MVSLLVENVWKYPKWPFNFCSPNHKTPTPTLQRQGEITTLRTKTHSAPSFGGQAQRICRQSGAWAARPLPRCGPGGLACGPAWGTGCLSRGHGARLREPGNPPRGSPEPLCAGFSFICSPAGFSPSEGRPKCGRTPGPRVAPPVEGRDGSRRQQGQWRGRNPRQSPRGPAAGRAAL